VNTVFPGRVVANAWAGRDAGRPRVCSVAGHGFPWEAGRDCQWVAEDAQGQPGVPQEPQCAPVRRKQNRDRQRDEHREVAAVAAVDQGPEDAWAARRDECRAQHRWADLQA